VTEAHAPMADRRLVRQMPTSVNSGIGPSVPARRLRPIGVRRPAGASGAAGLRETRAAATGEVARTERHARRRPCPAAGAVRRDFRETKDCRV